jgi:hypothetical protein
MPAGCPINHAGISRINFFKPDIVLLEIKIHKDEKTYKKSVIHNPVHFYICILCNRSAKSDVGNGLHQRFNILESRFSNTTME